MCRRTARDLRAAHPNLQALVVPSVGFLDDIAKYNLVIYLDRVDPAAFVAYRSVHEFRIDAPSGRITRLWDALRGLFAALAIG
jgi:hypothetical protein